MKNSNLILFEERQKLKKQHPLSAPPFKFSAPPVLIALVLKAKNALNSCLSKRFWYPGRESNPHDRLGSQDFKSYEVLLIFKLLAFFLPTKWCKTQHFSTPFSHPRSTPNFKFLKKIKGRPYFKFFFFLIRFNSLGIALFSVTRISINLKHPS